MTQTSKTVIANMALSNLGIGKEIGNADTENSAEARAFRRFFEVARDATLRDFPWSFATKFADLALIETDPTSEWGYSYQYPTDCLQFRRIPSGTRTDSLETAVKYKIARGTAGRIILTDQADAECEYTILVEAIEEWPADFCLALAWRLAIYMAPKITGGDPFKLRESAGKMYSFELALAQNNIGNEEQPDLPPESSFITGRE